MTLLSTLATTWGKPHGHRCAGGDAEISERHGKTYDSCNQARYTPMTSFRITRRTALKTGSALAIGGLASDPVTAQRGGGGRKLKRVDHSLLDPKPGEFAEASIRDDGEFVVVGSFFGTNGTTLVRLKVNGKIDGIEHRIESASKTRNADVKFDSRDGLYYRTQEKNAPNGDFGVEVIDYGFSNGRAPDDAEVVARIEAAGETHNLLAHPDPGTDILYLVNEHHDEPGLEIWDVSNPAKPRKIRNAAPTGGHNIIEIDVDTDRMHCAYIFGKDDGDPIAGYVLLDVSDPRRPKELGRFDYAGRAEYTQIGEEGFENCHYADFINEDTVVVGDEVGSGIPGGKHIFDISQPDAIESIGFTHSPNAEEQSDDELFYWTGHNFDPVEVDGRHLLVSGDYHEGTVLYDIEDPGEIEALDIIETDDGAEERETDPIFLSRDDAPFAWDADYNPAKDIVVTGDMITGLWIFEII